MVAYSVPRRYREFIQLHEKIRRYLPRAHRLKMPPMPEKEYYNMSSVLFGALWCRKTSLQVLQQRRQTFQIFQRWIENHHIARSCPAYVEFIGQPPQTAIGYVSLKEYSAPSFLTSLNQFTRERERKRRASWERKQSSAELFHQTSKSLAPAETQKTKTARAKKKKQHEKAQDKAKEKRNEEEVGSEVSSAQG
jgi:hypothetical protein